MDDCSLSCSWFVLFVMLLLVLMDLIMIVMTMMMILVVLLYWSGWRHYCWRWHVWLQEYSYWQLHFEVALVVAASLKGLFICCALSVDAVG